jgi:hypothetical protein
MEIFHADTDILEIIANNTTTQAMARTPSSGGNTSFIPREELLKFFPNNILSYWPSSARNMRFSKDLTGLVTILIDL